MPRTLACLPEGVRLTDFISLGVITKSFPRERINALLEETDRQSRRQRKLPAPVVVYYVIALALYMQVAYGEVLRCLVEGLQWLGLDVRQLRRTGKSGISQARKRLGVKPMRRLYEEAVGPIATPQTKGAWYRKKWRLVSLDGSTLDLADTEGNDAEFGRPGASRGKSGFPQLRFVSLVENGTHVLWGAQAGGYATGESTLAWDAVGRLQPGMLCLCDRNFFSYKLWEHAVKTRADQLWRVKNNANLPCLKRLPDGSYLSKVFASDKDRRHDRNGIVVRVIEYRLEGTKKPEELYRLITTVLDDEAAPAEELAALYHERWEIETALDEFKTHLRGSRIILRSKQPKLVLQEFYGLMLAHFAVRSLMHEAALREGIDPDELSFVHSVRVVRRKLLAFHAFPPSQA